MTNDLIFDFIIVGAGSAGCVLANRLTANGRHTVLLLEAGGEDKNPWIHIPIGYGKHFDNPKINWMYWSKPGVERIKRKVRQPRGKVVGGTPAQHFKNWGVAGCLTPVIRPYDRCQRG